MRYIGSRHCIDCDGIFFYTCKPQVRCPSCQKLHLKEMQSEYKKVNYESRNTLLVGSMPTNKRDAKFNFLRKIPMDENYASEQIKETLKIRDTILGEII